MTRTRPSRAALALLLAAAAAVATGAAPAAAGALDGPFKRFTAARPAAAPVTEPTGPLPAFRTEPYRDSAHVDTRVARARLAALEVKGRAPLTGYDRTSSTAGYGTPWKDLDRNGCDTRNDTLRRDLTGETFKADTGGCVVLTGTGHDPYTPAAIDFDRARASLHPVEHVVALADTWQKGAQQWAQSKREAVANDPLNLIVVSQAVNSSKGGSDAATWLPPNKAYRCAYAASQVEVKAKFGVWVTEAEKAALAAQLDTCPAQ